MKPTTFFHLKIFLLLICTIFVYTFPALHLNDSVSISELPEKGKVLFRSTISKTVDKVIDVGTLAVNKTIESIRSAESAVKLNVTDTVDPLAALVNETFKVFDNVSLNGTIEEYTISGKLNNITMTPKDSDQVNEDYTRINSSTVQLFPHVSNVTESRLPILNSTVLKKENENEGITKGLPGKDAEEEWMTVIHENFSKGISPIVWKTVAQCTSEQLTCFSGRTQNLRTENKTLIISPISESKSSPRQYTSARIYTNVHWPKQFQKLKVKIRAALPNADSVVPIMSVIINQSYSIQLAPPQVNGYVPMNLTVSLHQDEWQITLDRATGQLWFWDQEIEKKIEPFPHNVYLSIVLSSVIRTSENLPQGPIFWAGPVEEAAAMDVYKRQLSDPGEETVYLLKVYSVDVLFTKPHKKG